ncbi:uncharacterized protein AtWU_00584 [Aspergillus tubingensis]|uniref:uncharacterized protein n=1 Tax=Aspergillus tubingensis TaxID=5068 RepID=UPI001577B558|nr:uncharacterized protein AtWU_00584 [Aspergillus tubingensis]GFN10788.1 hypothetical protein AtWU_00584 [Aspergillus tubingensis]
MPKILLYLPITSQSNFLPCKPYLFQVHLGGLALAESMLPIPLPSLVLHKIPGDGQTEISSGLLAPKKKLLQSRKEADRS